MPDKREICRRCGAMCCRQGSVNGTPLTLFDMARICMYLDITPDQLFRLYAYILPSDLAASRLSEAFNVEFLPPLEPYVVRAKLKPDRSCIFLKGLDCVIHPAKPIVCKVFPVKLFPETQWLANLSCPLTEYPELLEEEYRYYPYYERETALNHAVLAKLLQGVESETEALDRIVVAVEVILRSGILRDYSDYEVSGRITLPGLLRLLGLE